MLRPSLPVGTGFANKRTKYKHISSLQDVLDTEQNDSTISNRRANIASFAQHPKAPFLKKEILTNPSVCTGVFNRLICLPIGRSLLPFLFAGNFLIARIDHCPSKQTPESCGRKGTNSCALKLN